VRKRIGIIIVRITMPNCKDCGREIGGKGKTGLCMSCAKKGQKSNNYQVWVKAICWNSHCRKPFNARPDQDPRFSLCPACAAARKLMSRNGRWVHDSYFSNEAEW